MFTAILVTSTIVIFREQNLVGFCDHGRIRTLSLRCCYFLYQHNLAGIKPTGEIFTQRLSLRRREFKDLGDLLGRRHPIGRNRFNQCSPHHATFRGFIFPSEKITEWLKEKVISRKLCTPQVRAVSRLKVWAPRFRYLLKSFFACHRSEVR